MQAGDFTTRPSVTGRPDIASGGTPEVVFVEDTFTGSNGTAITSHTGETGATWTEHPDSQYTGVASIQNNRTYATLVSAYYASGVPSSPDYIVEGQVTVISVLTSDGTGIVGRMDPIANTFYSFRIQNGNTAILHSMVAGSLSTLDSASFTVNTNDVLVLELKMVGTSIQGWINGSLICSAMNGAITSAGRIGFRIHDSQTSTTGFHLDYIKAYHPAVGGGGARPNVSGRPAVSGRTNLTFGQRPVLPLSEPDPTYPNVTGYDTINVPADLATLQAAINSAVTRADGSGNFKGVQIVLTAGTTYTITTTVELKKLTVPNPGGKVIIIRTSNLAGLPAQGTRATAAHASAMPKLVASSTMPKSGSSSCILASETDTDVGYYRLVGLELTAENDSVEVSRLIEYGSDAVTDVSSQAHHLGIDRCYIHGHDNLEITAAIRLHAADSFIVDTSILEIHDRSTDNQAISAINGGQRVLIQNCRLEASGENVLIGGGTTRAMNLMPSDWTFRRVDFMKPVAWLTSPIGAATITAQSLVSGGTLTVGTNYRWAIVGRGIIANSAGNETGESKLTNVFTPTAGNQSVTLTWNKVVISTANPHDAAEYRIYESADGGTTWTKYYTVTGTGAASYSLTINGSNTSTPDTGLPSRRLWEMKNIFELKIGGARYDGSGSLLSGGFLIEGCWFSVSPEEGQDAYALKITISNPSTARPHLSVSHLTFRNNVVRHCGVGINILGSDSSTSFTPVHTMLFENNLFEDIKASTWGGAGHAVYMHKGSSTNRYTSHPQNIQIIHNTFINSHTFLRVDDDEPPTVIKAHNWIVHSNIAAYGSQGVGRSDQPSDPASVALSLNFINLVFARNVLASGGSGSTFGPYQALNAFPTAANYAGVEFEDFDGVYPFPPTEFTVFHDFRLKSTSPYKGYGLDGRDAGADIDLIEAATGRSLTP